MDDQFLIRPSICGWNLQWNGQDLSSFSEQSHAVQAAATAARMCERRGRTAQVLVQDEDGRTLDHDESAS
jgi:hypothetical protein